MIIAINGLKASKDNLATLLAPYNSGEIIEVHGFRRDELMRFTVTLTPAIEDTWYLETDGDEVTARKRGEWLQQRK